jgi:hypothetical protein
LQKGEDGSVPLSRIRILPPDDSEGETESQAMTDFLTRFAQHLSRPPGASLQSLVLEPLNFPAESWQTVLRSLDPELAQATLEWWDIQSLSDAADALTDGDGPPATFLGMATWGPHVVKIIGFDTPMPPGPLSSTFGHSALIPPNMKTVGQDHLSHVLLDYSGLSDNVAIQHAAVAAVAYALYPLGGVVILNEEARAALPAAMLEPEEPTLGFWENLVALPLPFLYGGFVKMELSEPAGQIWLRTFCQYKFGLPEFALMGNDHSSYTSTFTLFCAIADYLRESGKTLEDGELIHIDEETQFTTRYPEPLEWWLDNKGKMIVFER